MLFASEQQRRAGVTAWVQRGLETDAKIVYVESAQVPAAQSLLNLLTEQHIDVAPAVRRGQLQVVDPNVGLGPRWQAQLVEDGLAAGYPAVRLGGDAGTAATVMSPTAHVDAERAADELCSVRPMSILCQYASDLPATLLERACATHAGGVRDGKLQIIPIREGLAVAGEVDLSNLAALRVALAAECAHLPDESTAFVVDLARLDILDVAGARTLVSGTSPLRSRGVVVRMRSAVPLVDRLLRQLGVNDIDGLVLESAS
jgi:anti-anti-sigma regulatory factor